MPVVGIGEIFFLDDHLGLGVFLHPFGQLVSDIHGIIVRRIRSSCLNPLGEAVMPFIVGIRLDIIIQLYIQLILKVLNSLYPMYRAENNYVGRLEGIQ